MLTSQSWACHTNLSSNFLPMIAHEVDNTITSVHPKATLSCHIELLRCNKAWNQSQCPAVHVGNVGVFKTQQILVIQIESNKRCRWTEAVSRSSHAFCRFYFTACGLSSATRILSENNTWMYTTQLDLQSMLPFWLTIPVSRHTPRFHSEGALKTFKI